MVDERRSELAAFLRRRRGEVVRADRGLPGAGPGGRRLVGLRREEVCYLAGISLSWYSWLEQGRDISPSRQVLDAVCRTLELDDAEHAYVLSLAGHAARDAPSSTPEEPPPGHVQRLLDALETAPAFALTRYWHIRAWNRAYARLFPHIETVPARARNLLWLVFTDPAVRELLPDWDVDVRRFLAEFRADVAAHLGDPALDAVVDPLMTDGDFRTWWAARDVHGFASRRRRFRHPETGAVELEHHLVTLADPPDLRLVIYLPTSPGASGS